MYHVRSSRPSGNDTEVTRRDHIVQTGSADRGQRGEMSANKCLADVIEGVWRGQELPPTPSLREPGPLAPPIGGSISCSHIQPIRAMLATHWEDISPDYGALCGHRVCLYIMCSQSQRKQTERVIVLGLIVMIPLIFGGGRSLPGGHCLCTSSFALPWGVHASGRCLLPLLDLICCPQQEPPFLVDGVRSSSAV